MVGGAPGTSAAMPARKSMLSLDGLLAHSAGQHLKDGIKDSGKWVQKARNAFLLSKVTAPFRSGHAITNGNGNSSSGGRAESPTGVGARGGSLDGFAFRAGGRRGHGSGDVSPVPLSPRESLSGLSSSTVLSSSVPTSSATQQTGRSGRKSSATPVSTSEMKVGVGFVPAADASRASSAGAGAGQGSAQGSVAASILNRKNQLTRRLTSSSGSSSSSGGTTPQQSPMQPHTSPSSSSSSSFLSHVLSRRGTGMSQSSGETGSSVAAAYDGGDPTDNVQWVAVDYGDAGRPWRGAGGLRVVNWNLNNSDERASMEAHRDAARARASAAATSVPTVSFAVPLSSGRHSEGDATIAASDTGSALDSAPARRSLSISSAGMAARAPSAQPSSRPRSMAFIATPAMAEAMMSGPASKSSKHRTKTAVGLTFARLGSMRADKSGSTAASSTTTSPPAASTSVSATLQSLQLASSTAAQADKKRQSKWWKRGAQDSGSGSGSLSSSSSPSAAASQAYDPVAFAARLHLSSGQYTGPLYADVITQSPVLGLYRTNTSASDSYDPYPTPSPLGVLLEDMPATSVPSLSRTLNRSVSLTDVRHAASRDSVFAEAAAAGLVVIEAVTPQPPPPSQPSQPSQLQAPLLASTIAASTDMAVHGLAMHPQSASVASFLSSSASLSCLDLTADAASAVPLRPQALTNMGSQESLDYYDDQDTSVDLDASMLDFDLENESVYSDDEDGNRVDGDGSKGARGSAEMMQELDTMFSRYATAAIAAESQHGRTVDLDKKAGTASQ
ncbi:hypothetical protein BC831DRAFT_449820 [Entophlyctis helioformis]|nr:hypothetical protein BC831DRAFT_449820 [Entophlyctis helioformis]